MNEDSKADVSHGSSTRSPIERVQAILDEVSSERGGANMMAFLENIESIVESEKEKIYITASTKNFLRTFRSYECPEMNKLLEGVHFSQFDYKQMDYMRSFSKSISMLDNKMTLELSFLGDNEGSGEYHCRFHYILPDAPDQRMNEVFEVTDGGVDDPYKIFTFRDPDADAELREIHEAFKFHETITYDDFKQFLQDVVVEMI